VLTALSGSGSRRSLERGLAEPLRLHALSLGTERHGLELAFELSYQHVWTEYANAEDEQPPPSLVFDPTHPEPSQRSNLMVSGPGLSLGVAYRVPLTPRSRFRFELSGRADGGRFTNGGGDYRRAGRTRLSLPLGVAVEHWF
jgi:hypothetical protein